MRWLAGFVGVAAVIIGIVESRWSQIGTALVAVGLVLLVVDVCRQSRGD